MDNSAPQNNAQQEPDDLQYTQETQQATQEASQEDQNWTNDSVYWGCLQPCKSESGIEPVMFSRAKEQYSLGRGDSNDVQLRGLKISQRHCKIVWDGEDAGISNGKASLTGVTIHDSSTNGTFINGQRIKKHGYAVLRDGNELALGSPSVQDDPHEDYRFIYRHLARKEDLEGIHAVYEMGNELGKGTFATVMKAIHKETGHWYAVKIIHNAKIRGPQTQSNMAAFEREVRILGELEHPNVCKFKEVFWGNGDDDTYLVLELIKGGDLLDYILRNGGLDEWESRRIAYQMCTAMAYIHGKGIAHRDLKPENVLLTTDDPPVVKIADFGLAKIVDAATMLKTMCGTPSYLAPEVVTQAATGQGYDNLVDSWSVGVIIFSMLTNASPFIDPDDTDDIRTKIVGRQIDWGTLREAGVSSDASDFIKRLLEQDPSSRMTLTDALNHPWLISYTNGAEHANAHPISTTRPGTPEISAANPDSSLSALGSVPDFYAPLRQSPSRPDNGAHDDLSLEGNGNLGLNGLKLSPQKRNLQEAQPSSSDMPGAYPKASSSRALERRSSVLARQEMEQAQRENGANQGTSTTPEESWQYVEHPVASPRVGQKRRSRPEDHGIDNGSDAAQGGSTREPVAKRGKRNTSAGKPQSNAAPPPPDGAAPRRSTRNKRG